MKRLLGVFGTRTGMDVSMALTAVLLGAAIGRREWWVVLLYALLMLAWLRLSAVRERMWRDEVARMRALAEQARSDVAELRSLFLERGVPL